MMAVVYRCDNGCGKEYVGTPLPITLKHYRQESTFCSLTCVGEYASRTRAEQQADRDALGPLIELDAS